MVLPRFTQHSAETKLVSTYNNFSLEDVQYLLNTVYVYSTVQIYSHIEMFANSLSLKTLAYFEYLMRHILRSAYIFALSWTNIAKVWKTKLTQIMTLWPYSIRTTSSFLSFTINFKASNYHNSQWDYLLVVRKCKHIHKVRSRRTVLLTFFPLFYFISSHQRDGEGGGWNNRV